MLPGFLVVQREECKQSRCSETVGFWDRDFRHEVPTLSTYLGEEHDEASDVFWSRSRAFLVGLSRAGPRRQKPVLVVKLRPLLRVLRAQTSEMLAQYEVQGSSAAQKSMNMSSER